MQVSEVVCEHTRGPYYRSEAPLGREAEGSRDLLPVPGNYERLPRMQGKDYDA